MAEHLPPPRSGPFEITTDGFIPGEDIVIAPILVHARADADGNAPALELAETFVAGEVIVFGRVSGTIHIVTRY